MLRLRIIGFLLVFFAPAGGFAANSWFPLSELDLSTGSGSSVPVYVSAFLDHQRLGIDDVELRTPSLSGAIGVWGWPGIGLEFELGKGIRDDSVNDLTLAVYSMQSLNLRLESPPLDGIALYVLFGGTRSNVDTRFSGDNAARKKLDLRGYRATIGMTLQATKQLAVDAAFTHHEFEDELGITSIRLGLRYDFAEVSWR